MRLLTRLLGFILFVLVLFVGSIFLLPGDRIALFIEPALHPRGQHGGNAAGDRGFIRAKVCQAVNSPLQL